MPDRQLPETSHPRRGRYPRSRASTAASASANLLGEHAAAGAPAGSPGRGRGHRPAISATLCSGSPPSIRSRSPRPRRSAWARKAASRSPEPTRKSSTSRPCSSSSAGVTGVERQQRGQVGVPGRPVRRRPPPPWPTGRRPDAGRGLIGDRRAELGQLDVEAREKISTSIPNDPNH